MSRPGKLTDIGMLAVIGAMMLPVALCERESRLVRPAEVRLPEMRPGCTADLLAGWLDCYTESADGKTWIRSRSY